MFKTIIANFHLEKIFWIIKTNLKYMILSALLCAFLAGGVGYKRQNSTYMAQISFYVYSNPEYITDMGVNLNTSEVSQARSLLASYMQILKSNRFLNMVLESLGMDQMGYTTDYLKRRIGATAINNTTVFVVSVYDDNPIIAMNVANAIGELAPAEIIRIVKSGGIEILDAAELPLVPYSSTNILLYAVVGAFVGAFLVAAFALLRGLLDTTIRRKYEVEDLFTIPIIGTVPFLAPKKKQETVELKLKEDSPFALKEAYSALRTNLMFTARGEKCPVYAVSSADCNEGKSVNCINIALSYAQTGRRVLLVDGDMRKSELAHYLDVKPAKTGLSDYLAGLVKQPGIQHIQDNFDVFFGGSIPPNPAELLISKNMEKFLEQMKQEYDVIIIDLPPIGIVSDALVIATLVTAYILVVREMFTKFDREEMIVRKLESVDANICGFIYNGISMKSPDYAYKNYGYEKGYNN